MIRNKTTLEHLSGNRVFHFICDGDSPTEFAREALEKFLQYISIIEQQAQNEKLKSEENITEE